MSTTLEKPSASSSVDLAVKPQHIAVRAVTGHIGAEIEGVDLAKPLPPVVIEEIKAALLKWKVVFFRDQPLTHEQHIAFAGSVAKIQ
jgi:taurine dioxygenase